MIRFLHKNTKYSYKNAMFLLYVVLNRFGSTCINRLFFLLKTGILSLSMLKDMDITLTK